MRLAVPSGAVLVGEAHQRGVGGEACRSSGFGEQHQGEQTDRLGFIGHQLHEDAAESDRFAREVGADEIVARRCGVAFGEDQCDRDEYDVQAVRQLGGGRDAIGGVVVAQLALRPHDPLRHRRLGYQERSRDLRCVEAPRAGGG